MQNNYLNILLTLICIMQSFAAKTWYGKNILHLYHEGNALLLMNLITLAYHLFILSVISNCENTISDDSILPNILMDNPWYQDLPVRY